MNDYIIIYLDHENKNRKVVIKALSEDKARAIFNANFRKYELIEVTTKERLTEERKQLQEYKNKLKQKEYISIKEYSIIEDITTQAVYKRLKKRKYKRFIKRNSSPTLLKVAILEEFN